MAGGTTPYRANRDTGRSWETTKPPESLCNFFRGVPSWNMPSLDALHDVVRLLMVGGEIIVNLGNARCARVAIWRCTVASCIGGTGMRDRRI